MDRTAGDGGDAPGPLGGCCAAQVLEDIQRSMSERQFHRMLGDACAAAAERGDPSAFGRLIDAGGVYPDSFLSQGSRRTMIGCAVFGGSADLVERLLAEEGGRALRQLNVAFGKDKATPAHVAVEVNAPEVLNILLRRGADPNIVTRRNNVSPLQLAVILGHRACGAALLQDNHGAIKVDVNARDSSGRTSLFQAVRHGRVGMVEDLLRAGANPRLTPKPTVLRHGEGQTPELGMPTCLGLAASEGNQVMVDVLVAHGKVSNKARVKISASSKMGANALHFAAQGLSHKAPLDMTAVVRALADVVDVNGTLHDGQQTALHVACSTRNVSAATVRAILAVGADINAVDRAKNTALHLACRRSLKSVIQVLLLHGVDDMAKNKRGKTAADVLDKNRHDVRRMLATYRDWRRRLAAQRAWRRRGWLILCRARAGRKMPRDGDEGKAGMLVGQARKKAKTNENGRGEGSVDAGGAGGGDAEQETDRFAQLVDAVVGSEERVFRHVVAYV
eukprot:g13850.t1